MTNYRLRDARKVFAALPDETRLRLLCALRQGELCVCRLIDLVALAPSTVSKRLSLMLDAGLLDARKDGRWVYSRLADRTDFPMFGKNAPKIFQCLEKSETVRADDRRLRAICKNKREVACPKRQGS